MGTRKSDRRANKRGLDYIVIECVTPEVDGGRYPAKRIIGDTVSVGADLIKDGHDLLAARTLFKGPGDADWSVAPMLFDFDERSLVRRVRRRSTRAMDVHRRSVDRRVRDLAERAREKSRRRAGRRERPARRSANSRARPRHARVSARRARRCCTPRTFSRIGATSSIESRDRARARRLIFSRSCKSTIARRTSRAFIASCRSRSIASARGSPRGMSCSRARRCRQARTPPRHGTFADAAAGLPRLASLGFDVVYLAPIHPIGRTFRKGKNNSLTPEPDDVGSPWAIGNENGGHTAIEPALGTIDDFDRFVQSARAISASRSRSTTRCNARPIIRG